MTADKNKTFNFSRALELIKEGHKLTREGWNGKNMFVFIVSGSVFKVNRAPLMGFFPEGTDIKYRPHIDMKAVDGTIGVWNPSMSDMLADDWFIDDEKGCTCKGDDACSNCKPGEEKRLNKSGMYGEMPKVMIGKFSISQMTDKEGETEIFISTEDGKDEGEGMGIDGKLLEPILEEFYNKNL